MDENQTNGDPVTDDEPPYFPVADPDAPAMPDWNGVELEGEQFPGAGADPEDDTAPGPDEVVF